MNISGSPGLQVSSPTAPHPMVASLPPHPCHFLRFISPHSCINVLAEMRMQLGYTSIQYCQVVYRKAASCTSSSRAHGPCPPNSCQNCSRKNLTSTYWACTDLTGVSGCLSTCISSCLTTCTPWLVICSAWMAVLLCAGIVVPVGIHFFILVVRY